MLEHAGLLAGERRPGVRVRLDGLVERLVLEELDQPVGDVLLGLRPLLSHGRVGRDVGHELHHVRVELELGDEIIDGAEGVVEGAPAIGNADDLLHRGIGAGQRVGDGRFGERGRGDRRLRGRRVGRAAHRGRG
jgi:hypothetical protein